MTDKTPQQRDDEPLPLLMMRVCPSYFAFGGEGSANAVFALKPSSASCQCPRGCPNPFPTLIAFLQHHKLQIPDFLGGSQAASEVGDIVGGDATSKQITFMLRTKKQPLPSLAAAMAPMSAAEGAAETTVDRSTAEALHPYVGAIIGLPTVKLVAVIKLGDFLQAEPLCSASAGPREDSDQASAAVEDGLSYHTASVQPNFSASVFGLLPKWFESSRVSTQNVSAVESKERAEAGSGHIAMELKPKRAWAPPATSIPLALQTAGVKNAKVMAQPLIESLAPAKHERCRYSQMLAFKEYADNHKHKKEVKSADSPDDGAKAAGTVDHLTGKHRWGIAAEEDLGPVLQQCAEIVLGLDRDSAAIYCPSMIIRGAQDGDRPPGPCLWCEKNYFTSRDEASRYKAAPFATPAGAALSALLQSPSNNLAATACSIPSLVGPDPQANTQRHAHLITDIFMFLEQVLATDASGAFGALGTLQGSALDVEALATLINQGDGVAPDVLSALVDQFYTGVTASDVSTMLSITEVPNDVVVAKDKRASLQPVGVPSGDWALHGAPTTGSGYLVTGTHTTSGRTLALVLAVIDIDSKRHKPVAYYADQDKKIMAVL
eukprot:GILI01027267.1.p1 GENE.GILI01027267.1~~GILI01027267.1.p1  ORF type:complete len:604 (+),score=118.45 GILI01027267.1:81-1892(+)